MKALFIIPILAAAFIGCQPAATIYYHSSGSADHFSSVSRTHFGAIRVWRNDDIVGGANIAFISASDLTNGPNTHDVYSFQYLLFAPELVPRPVGADGSNMNSFDMGHSISLRDSDARALLSALDMVANSPVNDSTYFHYSCETELSIVPSSVSTNSRGHSTVTTGVAPVTSWLTTCELTFYLGAGTLTLADGTVWTESLPLDRGHVLLFDSVLKGAITDIESQK